MKEIKCKACQKWNDAALVDCESCGENLRAEEIEREEKKFLLFDGEPTKFELWLKRVEQSKNPFVFISYRFFKAVYFVYMAIVGFVTWATVWLVG